MVVPVAFGTASFDYRPFRSEQSRLSKTLVLPSPRDKDDTAQVFEIEDDQAVPFKYPTFIKVRYDKEGTLPVFELWLKDNFDEEHKVSNELINGAAPAAPAFGIGTAAATQAINDDPLTAAGALSNVNDGYAVSPITGEIFRNAYWDHTTNTIRDAQNRDPSNAAFSGTLAGTVKYDAVTGLALAAVNTRISDVSNSIEGVTKVLQVAIGNVQAVLDIVR